MAETGRREVVGDPLALNPMAQAPDRSLQTMMVRSPGQTGGKLDTSVSGALSQFGAAVEGVMKSKEDDWIAEGKLQFMQGATEEQIAKTGNKYTMQGWQALNAADAANRWYADEANAISNGANKQDPVAYNKGLMERRSQFMQNLPDDPAIRKLYVNAFDDLGPRLATAQAMANNEWNKEQTGNAFASYLSSGSYTNADTPRVSANSPLALSPGKVRPTVEGYTDDDVDLMTRAVLGEAAGEGDTGMAAVAHNILNRTIDGGFGGRSIRGVVMKPGQYSAFNGETGYVGGEGKNNLINMDKNSAAYQHARQIVQHVLSGNNVDPTNGSTHYVAAGVNPNWKASVEAQGNNTQIGNHYFMGKARNLGNAASPSSGVLKFAHADQTNLDPAFASTLTNVGLQLGIDLTITSGHRSHNHPVERGKKSGGGTHTQGIAADIDMKGMSDEERANLVRTLKQNGVRRFGTYDNHKDMLHVDMSDKQGANWYMHNKSNQNIKGAPKWFQAIAAEPANAGGSNIQANAGSSAASVGAAAGIPTNASVSIAQTQTQDAIRGYNMPKDQKAAAVAQELVTQLSAGSTALWDNIGGVAFLNELGATPQHVRLVQNAYEAYQKEHANKFDMERAKWESGLSDGILTGKITLEDAEKQIQERYDANKITDTQAYALVSKVNAANVAEGRQPNMSPDLQRALANTYAAIRKDPNTYTAEWADEHIKWLATRHDIPPAQLQQRLAEAWQTEETAKNAIITKTEQAAKKAAEDKAKQDQVMTVLRSGVGMDTLTGSLNGIPLKQVAVNTRMDELRKQANEAVPQYMKDGMTALQATRKASAVAEDLGWREFQAQGGVVDEDLAAAVTAGASGVIVSAGGKVDESAKEALDTWLRMKQVDPTGSYSAKYAKTEQSRNLLMLAEKFFDGGYDMDSALRKAGEFMSKGLSDPPDVTKSSDFNRKLNAAMKDNFNGLMGNDSWFSSSKVSMGEKNFAMTNEGANNQLKQAISARAWAGFAAEPQNDPEIILKKAAQDVINDSVIVGGNVLTPRVSGGEPIMKQMGLRWTGADGKEQSYPQDAVNEAVGMWIEKFANDQISNSEAGQGDPTGWATMWREKRGGAGLFRNRDGEGVFQGSSNIPPFYATWDQDSGTLVVQLWENNERKNTVPVAKARPLYIPAAELGAWYKTQKEASGPNMIQKAWMSVWGK